MVKDVVEAADAVPLEADASYLSMMLQILRFEGVPEIAVSSKAMVIQSNQVMFGPKIKSSTYIVQPLSHENATLSCSQPVRIGQYFNGEVLLVVLME